jgi:hypothetical protein
MTLKLEPYLRRVSAPSAALELVSALVKCLLEPSETCVSSKLGRVLQADALLKRAGLCAEANTPRGRKEQLRPCRARRSTGHASG